MGPPCLLILGVDLIENMCHIKQFDIYLKSYSAYFIRNMQVTQWEHPTTGKKKRITGGEHIFFQVSAYQLPLVAVVIVL